MSAACHTPKSRSIPVTIVTPRRSLWHTLLRWSCLARQRRALATLEPHLLADIGLNPAQACREASRPFWDAPEHWRRTS